MHQWGGDRSLTTEKDIVEVAVVCGGGTTFFLFLPTGRPDRAEERKSPPPPPCFAVYLRSFDWFGVYSWHAWP